MDAVDVVILAIEGLQMSDDYADNIADSTAPFGHLERFDAFNGTFSAPIGALEEPGDRDLFQVHLIACGTYRFNLYGHLVEAPFSLSGSQLYLRDSSGTLITEGNFTSSPFSSTSIITLTATTTGTFYLDAGSSTNSTGTYWLTANVSAYQPASFELDNFSPTHGWTSNNAYPREVADVNGDGLADIVGFGQSGVYVSLGVGNGGFEEPIFRVANFGQASGWSSESAYPRHVADVNGDGLADIVGFGRDGVIVSLAAGQGTFNAASLTLASFGQASEWSNDNLYPRQLADVNGDGSADIVGFGQAGVTVALATGGGSFSAPSFKLADFGQASGWTSDNAYPRELADVNGDGLADIIGFGETGTFVALAIGGGSFASPFLSVGNLGQTAGWTTDNLYPREVADVNGDGMADIVGFGEEGVWLALATGSGLFGNVGLEVGDFGQATGWSSANRYPRMVADINGDGAGDIIGFGQDGVFESLSSSTLFL